MTQRKNLLDDLSTRHSSRAKLRGIEEEFDFGYKSHSGKSSVAHKEFAGQSCYHTHPPLKMPGTDHVIYGGNCSSPIVSDADAYVGLCTSMKRTARAWPWKKGMEFLFAIPDMSVPDKPEEFKKLIAWLRKQLDAGQKVHVGCIGGHGRTGMTLAALVSTYGEMDAITYVRKHYCTKAVESTTQVNFLHEHFGITKVTGAKAGKSFSDSSAKGALKPPSKSGAQVFYPLPKANSIWG